MTNTTILICAFAHTLINGILMGSLMNEFQETLKNNRFNIVFTIIALLLIFIVFALFMIELCILYAIYAFFTGEHFKISKYKLYILGLNIYFRPFLFDEHGEKMDLYTLVNEQKIYKIKKFWLFDVVYLDKKYCKEHNINTL